MTVVKVVQTTSPDSIQNSGNNVNNANEPKLDASGNPAVTDSNETFTTNGLDSIQIDDSTLFIKDGNVVNDKGEIVYTNEQFTEIKANSVDIEIPLIEKYSNIILTDELGNPLEFENNIKGVAKREQFIKERFYKEGAETAIKNLFESTPLLKDVYNHIKEKGNLDEFKPVPDYKLIKLSIDNPEQLEQIIIEAELKAGKTIKQAQKLITYYKADNTLLENATLSKDFLVKLREKEELIKKKEETDKKIESLKRIREYYGYYIDNGKEVILNKEGSVYDKIVNKRRLGEFVIPETGLKVKKDDGTIKSYTPKDIFAYIAFAANDEGYSQAEIDDMKHIQNIDNLLLRYIYNLTAGNLSELIPQTIADKKIKDMKRYTASGITNSLQNNSNPNKIVSVKTPVQ